MAYAPYEEDDQDKLSTVAQLPASASSAGGYGATQVNNPSGPSRFINFSSYFNANRAAAEGTGNQLAGGLETKAAGVQAGADKAQKETTTSAAANTLQAPVAGVPVVNDFEANRDNITESAAKERAATKYAGPTAETVAATYEPIKTQADTAGREIAQTGDAAGVKALRGGSGFDAQLARVGGNQHLSGLRQKYGGISRAVADSKALAVGAANTAQGTTATNAAAYGKLASDYAAGESQRVAAEKAAKTKAEQEGWNAALDNFNQSIGATPGAVMGEQQSGGHIPTTGERPTGANFVASLPPAFTNRASPLYVPPYYAERVFDAMSPQEAQQMLSMKKSGGDAMAFVQSIRQMAQKYGVN